MRLTCSLFLALSIVLLPTHSDAEWSMRGIVLSQPRDQNEEENEKHNEKRHARNNETNVFGGRLAHCSKTGTAVTGLLQDGYCSHMAFDERSHAICIDIHSFADEVEGSQSHQDFVAVIGRYDFLHQDQPCTAGGKAVCPVQNWCVNEHAFAFYVEKVGGCDNVGHVVCDSTSEQALDDFERMVEIEDYEGGKRATDALDCIRYKCWL